MSAPISSGRLPHSPWKQSRNSSRCPVPFTCMMDTGKLWEEEANTAGAKEWSFLSRNSVKAGKRRSLRTQKEPEVAAEPELRAGGALGPTLQRVLLHVNFVEFIGSDEDTVVGEVDTAAGLLTLTRAADTSGPASSRQAGTLLQWQGYSDTNGDRKSTRLNSSH